MIEETKVYTQEEVDDLRRQWETANFELKTNEVLTAINKRLDESNNYKATIGMDVKDIKVRIEQIETARMVEQKNKRDKMQWHQSWWIRIGIASAILFQGLNFLINLGVIR